MAYSTLRFVMAYGFLRFVLCCKSSGHLYQIFCEASYRWPRGACGVTALCLPLHLLQLTECLWSGHLRRPHPPPSGLCHVGALRPQWWTLHASLLLASEQNNAQSLATPACAGPTGLLRCWGFRPVPLNRSSIAACGLSHLLRVRPRNVFLSLGLIFEIKEEKRVSPY